MSNNNIIVANTLRADSNELLDTPAVADRLGEYAVRLGGVLNRVANVEVGRDGFLELGDQSEAAIPFVLRHLGQKATLHANDSHLLPLQINSLETIMGAKKAAIAEAKTRLHFSESQSHRELPVFEDKDGLAVTGSNFWLPNPETIVYGRPYVSMNVDAAVDGRLSPVVALHELTHVWQKEKSPIGRAETLGKDKIRRELEAYYVSAQIILGMKDAGRQRELLGHTSRDELERALKIESVRIKSQRNEDPFDPNDQVIESLTENSLGITTEVGNLIRNKRVK